MKPTAATNVFRLVALLVAIAIAPCGIAPGADILIAYEAFDYANGLDLKEQNGGTGWNGAWFASDNVRGITIGQPGVVFPELIAAGGKILQDGNDTRIFRRLDTARLEVAAIVEEGSSGKTFGKDGTTIWISFLIANTAFPKQAHGGMHLMDGVTLGSNYKKTQRVQLGRQNMGEHWLLVRTDQGGPAAGKWDGTVTSDKTVRLLVYRFDFKAGPEEGWMWVDPVPGQEPDLAKADLHAPTIADFRFNAVNVGSGGGATFDFDELRIGTRYSMVAPAQVARTAAEPPKSETAPADAADTFVFRQPMLAEVAGQMMREAALQFQRGESAKAEELLRRSTETAPFLAATHYNLGCILALRDHKEDAFRSLETAISKGFIDARNFEQDKDLISLRTDDRFAALSEKMKGAAKQPQTPPTEPCLIADGIAWVSAKNTTWDQRTNTLHTHFQFPPRSQPPPAIIANHGKVGDQLRAWFAEGTAAGNFGDLYDNCDRDHSNLRYQQFPQLARIEYEKEIARFAAYGLNVTLFHQGVVMGNSSTAMTSSPYWRSNVRRAYVDPRGAALLYQQYVSNKLYLYPEHRDHDPGHNGAGDGYGDVFPANTPYVITSQGSSGSDNPFMDAVVCTLAAFRPEVKQRLKESGQLMAAVQMIFRSSNKVVKQPADYLTGAAHPTVFDAQHLDVLRMIEAAHALTLETLPPLIQIRMVEEDQPLADRDFFDAAKSETLFDTPCAIARVHRSVRQRRRMVVSAEGSVDPNKSPLKFHWVVLRGDADRITITPRNDAKSVAEIVVPYHARRPIEADSKMESNRVDLGVFAHNGENYSAPAFISVFSLDHEAREYDATGQIRSVTYTGASEKGNYVDPFISLPKSWRDEYRYDEQQHLLGWTRHRGDQQEEFTADGALVETKDDQGRPLTARPVRYVAKPRDRNQIPLLERQLAEERFTYQYADEKTLLGTVKSREAIEPEANPPK
jgi:hypothetical protein